MFATTLLLFRHFCIVCHICRVHLLRHSNDLKTNDLSVCLITNMIAVRMVYAKATTKLFEVLVTHGSEEVKYVIQEVVHTLDLHT